MTCGAPLVAAAPQERRTVTILFVDLVGFTERSDTADPEDVRRTLVPVPRAGEGGDRALRRASGQVHRRRRDGRVRRPGHPRGRSRARGARRARAGGGLRRWAPDPRRRAHRRGRGLDGHRPAGRRGGGRRRREHREPPAVGRAARRRRDRRAHVDRGPRPLRDRGARALHRQGKGRADPFLGGARRARGVAARPSTSLVGRQRELAMLDDIVARARDERCAQLVTIVAEPGIGKSRLVVELRRALGEDVGWLAERVRALRRHERVRRR